MEFQVCASINHCSNKHSICQKSLIAIVLFVFVIVCFDKNVLFAVCLKKMMTITERKIKNF